MNFISTLRHQATHKTKWIKKHRAKDKLLRWFCAKQFAITNTCIMAACKSSQIKTRQVKSRPDKSNQDAIPRQKKRRKKRRRKKEEKKKKISPQKQCIMLAYKMESYIHATVWTAFFCHGTLLSTSKSDNVARRWKHLTHATQTATGRARAVWMSINRFDETLSQF